MSNFQEFKKYCDYIHPDNGNYFACYGDAKPIQLFDVPANQKTFQTLKQHNDNGYDIYLIIQPSTGFQDTNVLGCRFVLADWDVGRQAKGSYYPIEVVRQRKAEKLAEWEQLIATGKMPRPSLIIETRNGFQLYWQIDPDDPDLTDSAIYTATITAIADNLKSDPKVSNPGRVFRVPGFMWRKTSEGLDPYPATIVWHNPDLIYTYQQIIKCFPYDKKMEDKLREKRTSGVSPGVDTSSAGTYWIYFKGKRPFQVTAFWERGQLHAACIYCDDQKGHDIVFYNNGWVYCNRCSVGGIAVDEVTYQEKQRQRHNRFPVAHQSGPDSKCPNRETPKFPLTEAGNAERLCHYYGDKLRYICEQKRWASYRDGKWNVVKGDKVAQYYALQMARKIRNIEAEGIEDQDIKDKYMKWGRQSESNAKINNTLNIAQCLFPFQCYQEEFDSDITLLNCKNGTINLATGELLDHSPAHLITQMIDINYNPEAKCPIWLKALDKYMLGDKEMITYLQQLSGICLSGHSERIFPIFYGLGKNGKSVFIDTLLSILGDYGWHAPESFLQQKNNPDPFTIANLRGKRFVCLSETKKNMQLDASLVKSMTGDKQLTARFLYGNHFSFSPTHISILTTQNLPTIKESSSGIWDRIQQVNWQCRITQEEEDKDFLDKLKPEYEGILNWMVKGALSYQKEGLHIPEQIKLNTQEFKDESGAITSFIEEKCSVEFDTEQRLQKLTYDEYKTKISRKELYVAYAHTEKFPLGSRKFAKEMKDLGFQPHKSGNTRYWLGISIKNNESSNILASSTDEDNEPDPDCMNNWMGDTN